MGDPFLPIPEQFNVAQYFIDRHLEEGRGDALAVLYRDQSFTYRQVAEQVNRAANVLRREGVESGDRIMLLLLDSPDFVWAFWGAIKLGGIPIPTNSMLAPDDYEFMLNDSGSRFVVVDEILFEKIAPFLNRVVGVKAVWVAGETRPGYRSFEEELAASPPEATAAPTHRDDPAFWLYTSGSTGRPKAAIHVHHDMVYCFDSYAKQVLQIQPSDRTFSTSKLYFAYGLGNALYFPFGVGASTVLLAERPTAEKVFEVITRYRPTIFYSVPAIYAAMLKAPDVENDGLSSVRCAVSAGEALPVPLGEQFRRRFGIPILDGIGSTEMLHMFISNRLGDAVPGSCGKPVPGYDARIVDDQGNEVPPGQMGELLIRGDSAAAGYWNRPELTQKTFRGGWTATGDKFICDERGYFWYCGRTDDMLKVSGLWVSPLEIESALLTHPAVLECAIVGATDSDGLTKPKAFVVLRDHASAPPSIEADLHSFLRGRLAGYKVPEWIVLTESLPRTATGKVQRFKLRQASNAGLGL